MDKPTVLFVVVLSFAFLYFIVISGLFLTESLMFAPYYPPEDTSDKFYYPYGKYNIPVKNECTIIDNRNAFMRTLHMLTGRFKPSVEDQSVRFNFNSSPDMPNVVPLKDVNTKSGGDYKCNHTCLYPAKDTKGYNSDEHYECLDQNKNLVPKNEPLM